MQYLYPLIAIHIGGYTELLYNSDEVLAFIKKYGQFYEHHKYWAHRYAYNPFRVEYFYDYHDWIVRDDRGRTVKYEDVCYKHVPYSGWNERNAKIRKIAEKGLPIPGTGCSKAGWRMNHTAKKNSGAGHRNRNRAKAIYEAKEYGVKNDVGGRVIPWENY